MYVELRFRILKHEILKKNTRLKPNNFVRIVYEDMQGRLGQYILQTCHK